MRYVTLLVAVLALVACSDKQQVKDDRAARAAKEYYDCLVAGKYDEYIAGVSDADSLPPAYRDQLTLSAKQLMAQQKAEHGGVVEVKIVNYKCDSLSHRTDVFLMLSYADSTKEEIVVPMVERGNVWKMK